MRQWVESCSRGHRVLEHGYLERAVAAIRQTGQTVTDESLAPLSPLKWEHINLTGDYHWAQGRRAPKPRVAASPGQQTRPQPLACKF